jgi:hypothetical protein
VAFKIIVFPRSSFIGVPSDEDTTSTTDLFKKVDIKVTKPNKKQNFVP